MTQLDADEFKTQLTQLNEKLTDFDRVSSLERSGKQEEARAEIVRIGTDVFEQLKTVAEQRSAIVQENYQVHELVSATDDRDTLDHLDAHLNGTEFGSVFSKSDTFPDSASIISFTEDWLEKAYRGEMQPGQSIPTAVNGNECLITLLNSNDKIDGQDVGYSNSGGRVVIKVEFKEAIGKDAIVELGEGMTVRKEPRTLGGRNEEVNIVEGSSSDTNTMYVIGGSFGPTGKFGLYTTFPGTYAPPMNDEEYWSAHGFYEN